MFCSSNPLDEFSILFYNYLMLGSYNFSYSTLLMQLSTVNFFFIILFLPSKIYLIPNIYQYTKEFIFNFFICYMIDKNISFRSIKFFILYFNLFFFLLASNLLALIHFSQSITAHLMVTLFFSLSGFLALNIIGFILYKSFFYKIIEPEDVPRSLFVFILIIEFFSFLIRPFSLAIRLFANMLAGHMLLVLIGIFILYLLRIWPISSFIFFDNVLNLLILLEIVICFIQAYVFLVLFLTYIEQVYILWNK